MLGVVAGPQSAGKTTVAEYLVNVCGFMPLFLEKPGIEKPLDDRTAIEDGLDKLESRLTFCGQIETVLTELENVRMMLDKLGSNLNLVDDKIDNQSNGWRTLKECKKLTKINPVSNEIITGVLSLTFNSTSKLLHYVTGNWKRDFVFVLRAKDGYKVWDIVGKRPFAMLINVNAPSKIRYSRYISQILNQEYNIKEILESYLECINLTRTKSNVKEFELQFNRLQNCFKNKKKLIKLDEFIKLDEIEIYGPTYGKINEQNLENKHIHNDKEINNNENIIKNIPNISKTLSHMKARAENENKFENMNNENSILNDSYLYSIHMDNSNNSLIRYMHEYANVHIYNTIDYNIINDNKFLYNLNSEIENLFYLLYKFTSSLQMKNINEIYDIFNIVLISIINNNKNEKSNNHELICNDASLIESYINGNNKDFINGINKQSYLIDKELKDSNNNFNLINNKMNKMSLINNKKNILYNKTLYKNIFIERLKKMNLTNEERLRPDWDRYFMELANLASQRSNCMKRRVGCILVNNKRIIATGYNGTPRGIRNCNEGGCSRCNEVTTSGCGNNLDLCLCLHAEENALLEAGRKLIEKEGETILYCNTCPCLGCSKKIVQVGVKEVIYSQEYGMDDLTSKLLSEAGIILRQLKPLKLSYC